MGDADKNNLFPVINPNIDQLIQDEKMLDSDNAIKNEIIDVVKQEQEDIFETPKPKPISQKKKEHLENARIKSAETRRQKAKKKKKLKEEEKARKEEEKRLRREATAERNRVKARERYYKQREQKEKVKEEVKEIPKQIVKDTTPMVRDVYKQQQVNNMDFNTFAKYMMKYETLKEQYNKEIEDNNKKEKEIKKQEETKSYHPKNYPLRNYYHKDRMRNFTNF